MCHFNVECPDLDLRGTELLLARNDTVDLVLRVELVPKGKVSALEHTRNTLEVVLDHEVRVTELYPAAILVPRVRHLVVRLPLDRVEAQVLRQVEEEAGVVPAQVEARRPTVRGETAKDEIAILVVFPTCAVLVLVLNLKDD